MLSTTKLNREQLSTDDGAILNGRYRSRLFTTTEVPIICNFPSLIGQEVIVIDLPKAEGKELKVSELRSCRDVLSSKSLEEINKENVPAGCEVAGEPLEVSFLSIDKLDKTKKRNDKGGDENVIGDQLLDCASFPMHLLTSAEAVDLVNDLSTMKPFEDSLSNLCYFVPADASSGRNLIFLAHQRFNKMVTNYKASYLGNMKDSIQKLNAMTAPLQVLEMRRCICRCRFDVLKDVILCQKLLPDFIAASFQIQAQWAMPVAKRSRHREVIPYEKLLSLPPDSTVVTVKFKPGWMDQRVVLTDSIIKLRDLSDMAMSLKNSKIPWTAADEETENSEFLLQGVSELIEMARDKPNVVQPFDFIDRLWDVIRMAKSIDTLKKAFEMVYAELRTGEFRVLIEADKISSLAKMLRIRNLGNMVFPRLDPLTCLQMLVEIGVDRFRGDVLYRFLKDEFISNGSDLEPFFFTEMTPIEERIDHLTPLYLALQSMMMIEKHVQLPQHKKMVMTKRLLRHFTAMKNVDAGSKEFSFQASMEDVRRDVLKSSMSEWSVERVYEKLGKNQTITGYLAGSASATSVLSSASTIVTTVQQSPANSVVNASKRIGFDHIAPHLTLESAALSNGSGDVIEKCYVGESPSIRPPLSTRNNTNNATPQQQCYPIKNEVMSADRPGIDDMINNTSGANTTDTGYGLAEGANEELYECVHILVTATSLASIISGPSTVAPSAASSAHASRKTSPTK